MAEQSGIGITNERGLTTLSDLHAKFGWEEYVVLTATLAVSGLIGVFWACRSRQEESNAMQSEIKLAQTYSLHFLFAEKNIYLDFLKL